MYDEDRIIKMLEISNLNVEKAIVGLYKLHNNRYKLYKDLQEEVGIRDYDRDFLFSLARWILEGRRLTKKQVLTVREILIPDIKSEYYDNYYLNQLVLIANKRIQRKSVIGQYLQKIIVG